MERFSIVFLVNYNFFWYSQILIKKIEFNDLLEKIIDIICDIIIYYFKENISFKLRIFNHLRIAFKNYSCEEIIFKISIILIN